MATTTRTESRPAAPVSPGSGPLHIRQPARSGVERDDKLPPLFVHVAGGRIVGLDRR